ncbi:MAG: bacillithiol biosynthesis deacetylase BshB1 [Planctomycetota bacterium]
MFPQLDALFIATHPDDAESTCGGTIAKLVSRNARVGILDISQGEMGTRGTVEERKLESEKASAVLGISWRGNLSLPDGRVANSIESRETLARRIAALRPHLMFAPWWVSDLHPDHAATGKLCREAYFLAGLSKLMADQKPHRPKRVYYYPSHDPFEPQFIVAIDSNLMTKKLDSIKCYGSQLNATARKDDGKHFVHGMDLLERIVLRNRYFGSMVGAEFGEPFRVEGMLNDSDPLSYI